VPSLWAASCTATVPSEKSPPGVDDYNDNNSDNCSGGDGDGGGGGGAKQRCTKATIIAKATAYILAQERDSKRLRADMALCQSLIAAFEALEQAGVVVVVVGSVAAVGGGVCGSPSTLYVKLSDVTVRFSENDWCFSIRIL
jgi:hypothetical protein